MAGPDPYGLSYWDDFWEGLGVLFADDFDAKEAERKLRDAQRLLEERLREQVERGIISTDAQLSMVEAMERDISAAAAQMHEIEAQQAKMVRDTAIEIGITVATAGAGSVAMKAISGGWKHRVFYSGLGDEGFAYLKGWTAKRGGVMLDDTLLGKTAGAVAGWLGRRGWNRAETWVWKRASWVFARYAGRNSSVVLGDWRADRVWNTVEAVVLKNKGIDFDVFRYRPNSPLPAGWSPRRRRRPFNRVSRPSARAARFRRSMR